MNISELEKGDIYIYLNEEEEEVEKEVVRTGVENGLVSVVLKPAYSANYDRITVKFE